MDAEKQAVIDEIARLIPSDGSSATLSPDVMRYFEMEELLQIRDGLRKKKETVNEDHLEWLMQFKSGA